MLGRLKPSWNFKTLYPLISSGLLAQSGRI